MCCFIKSKQHTKSLTLKIPGVHGVFGGGGSKNRIG